MLGTSPRDREASPGDQVVVRHTRGEAGAVSLSDSGGCLFEALPWTRGSSGRWAGWWVRLRETKGLPFPSRLGPGRRAELAFPDWGSGRPSSRTLPSGPRRAPRAIRAGSPSAKRWTSPIFKRR